MALFLVPLLRAGALALKAAPKAVKLGPQALKMFQAARSPGGMSKLLTQGGRSIRKSLTLKNIGQTALDAAGALSGITDAIELYQQWKASSAKGDKEEHLASEVRRFAKPGDEFADGKFTGETGKRIEALQEQDDESLTPDQVNKAFLKYKEFSKQHPEFKGSFPDLLEAGSDLGRSGTGEGFESGFGNLLSSLGKRDANILAKFPDTTPEEIQHYNTAGKKDPRKILSRMTGKREPSPLTVEGMRLARGLPASPRTLGEEVARRGMLDPETARMLFSLNQGPKQQGAAAKSGAPGFSPGIPARLGSCEPSVTININTINVSGDNANDIAEKIEGVLREKLAAACQSLGSMQLPPP